MARIIRKPPDIPQLSVLKKPCLLMQKEKCGANIFSLHLLNLRFFRDKHGKNSHLLISNQILICVIL